MSTEEEAHPVVTLMGTRFEKQMYNSCLTVLWDFEFIDLSLDNPPAGYTSPAVGGFVFIRLNCLVASLCWFAGHVFLFCFAFVFVWMCLHVHACMLHIHPDGCSSAS